MFLAGTSERVRWEMLEPRGGGASSQIRSSQENLREAGGRGVPGVEGRDLSHARAAGRNHMPHPHPVL